MSKLLGKETLDTNTFGKSTGHNGNYSTNYQQTARDLLSPDEVRMLDNRYALLFIRGERPVQDDKYDILRHPNVSGTTDGNASPFDHGETVRDVAVVTVTQIFKPKPQTAVVKSQQSQQPTEPIYELLSDEDFGEETPNTEKEKQPNENNEKPDTQAPKPNPKPQGSGQAPPARWR